MSTQFTSRESQYIETLSTEFDYDDADEGIPDVGVHSTMTREEHFQTFIEGAMEKIVSRVVSESVDADANVMGLRDLFDETNIKKVYASQEPWRAPEVVVVFEEIAEYARLTESTDVFVETKPGRERESTAFRFQLREGW